MKQVEQIDLGALEPFDRNRAITVTRACEIVGGRCGRRQCHAELVRGWIKKGVSVGPRKLVLPAIKIANEWLTMESWLQRFQQLRFATSPRSSNARMFT